MAHGFSSRSSVRAARRDSASMVEQLGDAREVGGTACRAQARHAASSSSAKRWFTAPRGRTVQQRHAVAHVGEDALARRPARASSASTRVSSWPRISFSARPSWPRSSRGGSGRAHGGVALADPARHGLQLAAAGGRTRRRSRTPAPGCSRAAPAPRTPWTRASATREVARDHLSGSANRSTAALSPVAVPAAPHSKGTRACRGRAAHAEAHVAGERRAHLGAAGVVLACRRRARAQSREHARRRRRSAWRAAPKRGVQRVRERLPRAAGRLGRARAPRA